MAKNSQPTQRVIALLIKTSLIIFLLLWVGIMIASLLPYPKTAALVNRLAADGKLERFTQQAYATLRLPVLTIAAGFLMVDLLALLRFQDTKRILGLACKCIPVFFKTFLADWKIGWAQIKAGLDRKTLLILTGLLVLAFVMRIALLNQPMEHDESYTAVVFAFEPLVNGLSDYHFPNNHVFHTFLVHLAYRLFGAQAWAVRLPAFFAGVLLAPLGYLLARRWYGQPAAWLTGVLTAVLPDLIGYSVRARGYSMMAMFTLLTFLCADVVRKKKNRAVWFLFATFGALGFYTLPIMAYPLFVIYAWLGLSWLVGDVGKGYTKISFLIYLVASGILAAGLGLFLYVPIFRNWGVSSLFANPNVKAMSKALYPQTLTVRFRETWQVLNWGELPGIGLLLLIGFGLAIVCYRQFRSQRVSLPLVSVVVIGALVGLQRPNAYPRTWHFYFPLLCMWAAAGFSKAASKRTIRVFRDRRWRISSILAVMAAGWFFLNGLSYVAAQQPGQGAVEQATLYLKEQLGRDDIVVITAMDDMPLIFYFEKYGLGRAYFSRIRPFQRAFVVVTTSDKNQSLEFVVADRGPDPIFFDWKTTQKVRTIADLDIYQIEANHTAIQMEYGLP